MEIKVDVIEQSDRKHYLLRWVDPLSGKRRFKSSGIPITGLTRDRKKAEKIAAQLESDLENGRHKIPSKITWDEFVERYIDEVVPGLAVGTGQKIANLFSLIGQYSPVEKLNQMNAQRISTFVTALRDKGDSDSTIAGYCSHLKAALNWARKMKFIHELPEFIKVKAKQGKIMKGRPITTEELERMLTATQNVVGEERAAEWKQFLRGLWTTGLRIGEGVILSWDRDAPLSLELSGKYPMLRIKGEAEKGGKDRLLPLVPEAARFLNEFPVADREGLVLPLRNRVGKPASLEVAGRTISDIGERARVKVGNAPGNSNRDAKYASAHDIRRAFGLRWSRKVMPAVLKEIMRHESIETTMQFYVGQNAEATAAALWATETENQDGFGNTLGNSPVSPSLEEETQVLSNKRVN